MSRLLKYTKNLVQLVLSPKSAWEEIKNEDPDPNELSERSFNPLLSLVALTAFINGFYGIEKFDVARQLMEALCQFLSLYLGAMLCSVIFETMLERLCLTKTTDRQRKIVIIYCLSLMGVINIITNLCPYSFTILWLLPAFIAIVAWYAHDFLGINKFRKGQYFALSVLCLIGLPIVLNLLLHLLVSIA